MSQNIFHMEMNIWIIFHDMVWNIFEVHSYSHEYAWHAPKLFKKPKGGSHNETMEKEESWGTFFNLQHFEGRRAC